MKTKYIILKEGYDWLSVGSEENEITLSEYRNLCLYLKKNIGNKSIVYDYNRIKFINYVGIIKVNNLIIEILPKISLSNDIIKDREILMFMLSKCNKLSVDIKELLNSNILKNSLLDILAKVFSKKLLNELQKGLYREYVSKEEALSMIKGKILISKSIKENTINKNKMNCKYDEFTEDNLFNAILKRAINVILFSIKNDDAKKELNIINNIFNDVSDIYVPNNIILNYKLNRMNNRFLECFTLAKLILLNSSMDKSLGKENGFSILFEMNYLYEEYVGVLLKEVFNDTNININININTQEKSRYLLWNTLKERNEIALKPDIVIYKDNKPKIIIDTKWKSATIDGKEVYTQGDIYQMYAYITTYEECQQCILLYPKINENIKHSEWILNDDIRNKKILIYEINLENYEKTKNELLYLINKY
ncbi:McrC family protein [Clostridium sp.]|uniref:McrC family protein n=1 Tax=Clostridium sp. TaxID=1506 RepID=UPI0039906577